LFEVSKFTLKEFGIINLILIGVLFDFIHIDHLVI